jgi:DNA-binding GntR family transcriptional regulator
MMNRFKVNDKVIIKLEYSRQLWYKPDIFTILEIESEDHVYQVYRVDKLVDRGYLISNNYLELFANAPTLFENFYDLEVSINEKGK